MRRRLKRVVVAILLLALAAYAVLVWIASTRFTHVRNYRPMPDEHVAGLGALEATTDDGLVIRGSFAEPPDPKGVVVVFHGVAARRPRGILPVIAGWGFVGVAFDFRGHGESDGEVTTFGWDERRDVAAAIGAVHARWPGRRVAAWGISLGGAALCYAADVVRDLDAVVLESVYRDIDSAFERRVTTRASPLLVLVATPVKWVVAWRLGIRPSDLRPFERTGRLRPERTLIVTGACDPWAGPGDLEALAAPLPGCATFIVPGAGHDDLWKVGGDAYIERIHAFLAARLP